MAKTLVIDVQPVRVDIKLYAGDGVAIRLLCVQGEDSIPLPITGTVEAQIRVDRHDADPPIVEFTADLSEADPEGIVFLKLTGTETQALVDDASASNGVFKGEWDVEWHPTGTDPRTILQGSVECVTDVTR